MNHEILSLETAEKLAKLDKAIKFIKSTYFYTARSNGKTIFQKFIDELLKILEG